MADPTASPPLGLAKRMVIFFPVFSGLVFWKRLVFPQAKARLFITLSKDSYFIPLSKISCKMTN